MKKLRISSGTAKNIILDTPNIPEYRAVQEVAKQAVFNILADNILGKECLDLYAGSGNMGLEALSRGALLCDFVDENKRSTNTIESNVIKCGFENKTEIIKNDAVKYVSNTPEKYDFIFADPFYKNTSHIHLFKGMQEILHENGMVIFFHGGDIDWEDTLKDTKFKIVDNRRFGKSHITFLTV